MEKALQTMIDNMPEKTGKSLSQWKTILAEHKFEKHGQAVKFLKEQYGVTHGFANTIVQLSKDSSESPEDLVTIQYSKKEGLIPIYQRLIGIVEQLGSDVNVVPKKTSVSIIRKTQFALIKPATKTRIDLGLKIKGQDPVGRLEPSGPFGTMCTHRIQLTSIEEVDDEVINWLKTAYEGAS